MNRYNIDDLVRLRIKEPINGVDMDDDPIVQIIAIQKAGDRVLYTGAYDPDIGKTVQFTGGECTGIRHTSN